MKNFLIGDKKKYLIFVLISFLTTAIVSIAVVFVVIKQKRKNLNSDIKIENVYAWSGSGTSADPYQIKSTSDMTALANNVAGGNSYSGKYFRMMNSIDFVDRVGSLYLKSQFKSIGSTSDNRNDIVAFQGNFDGGGYFLSNMKIYSTNFNFLNPGYGFYAPAGLFACLGDGAQISNLGMYDIEVVTPFGDNISMANSYSGTIAGITTGNVLISNCKITNVDFVPVNGINDVEKSTGGILGCISHGSTATIEDCLVQEMNVDLSDETYYTQYRAGGILATNHNATPRINRCVVQAMNVQTADLSKTTTYPIAPSGVTNSYSAKDTNGFVNLNPSTREGTNGWFYHSTQYSGWPYLKLFVNWVTVIFEAETGGTVSPGSVSVPLGCYPDLGDGTSETISVLDTAITATPDSGYEFKQWSTDDNVTYKAQFEQKRVKLKFLAATHIQIESATTEFDVPENSTISVVYNKSANTLTYTCAGNIVVYKIDAAYTVDSYGWAGTSTSSTVGTSGLTINPTVKLKSYKVEIK